MRQTAQVDTGTVIAFPAASRHPQAGFSPRTVADTLLRADPLRARSFAVAMHINVAWANESWAAFWADVVALV